MWWLKNCWSFSLTKLMEICSKPLYSKISKPAMSSTAQKFAFFTNGKNERCSSLAHLECGVDQSVVTFDDQPLEQSVKDSTGNATNGSCSLFTSLTCVGKKSRVFQNPLSSPLVTHSVPTLILGLQNALIVLNGSIKNAPKALPGNDVGLT